MKIEVSNGEIADKISILIIKSRRIKDDHKLANIKKELNEIVPIFLPIYDNEIIRLFDELMAVNNELWYIEGRIRTKEEDQEFDSEFILLARSVYKTNDKRSQIKSEINSETNSELREEKSYSDYLINYTT
jgi:hypothetical protein